jgi:glycerol-3-phosphate cytidylyltransferase
MAVSNGIALIFLIFIKMKIGVIAGNFDVIHPGYIYMFNECVLSCDELVVLLHDDPSIERPEKLKPILSVEERMLILKSLKHVDRVFTYNTESELYKLLTEIKPDVRFLGDDYINKPFTGDDLDIRIYYLDRSHGWSTTKYKKMIAETLKIG